MNEFAPNLTEITGSVIGAKLIYELGSLKKLAMIPSSRIQIIGSKKSLFKHLKHNNFSPKHGIIYNHPLISSSKKEKRGKISKVLSFIISIASKIDYYSKKKKNIKTLLIKKIEKIK